MKNPVRYNYINLSIIKVSHWFMLVMPIVVLFYKANGLGVKELFILQSIYSVSIVALEIPSGYLADVLGRKNSIVIGSILGFLGYLTYSFSYGFWGFMVAEIILGIGQSMISGADSALLYDTLIDQKRDKHYLKYEGRMISFGNFAEALAGLLGGLLAALSIRYPYYGQTAVAFIGIPAALLLVEPHSSRNRIALSWSQIINVVHFALVKNITLRWNIIFSSIVGASTLTMAWFIQPWLIRADLPVGWFGAVWTILNLIVGVSAIYAYRIYRKTGAYTTLVALSVTIGLGFIISGIIQAFWGIAVIALFYIARGVATPILKERVNRLSPSSMRATILSIRNFIIRIIFALWGPIYGWITDAWSLKLALIIAGAVFLVLAAISFIFTVKTESASGPTPL